MTVLRVFDHSTNHDHAAEQDYELAKRHVQEVLESGDHRNPKQRARFFAAIERRERARERWLRTL